MRFYLADQQFVWIFLIKTILYLFAGVSTGDRNGGATPFPLASRRSWPSDAGCSSADLGNFRRAASYGEAQKQHTSTHIHTNCTQIATDIFIHIYVYTINCPYYFSTPVGAAAVGCAHPLPTPPPVYRFRISASFVRV